MWKGLFLLVFVVSIDVVISTDDEPAEPTLKPRCGCGGYPPKCPKNEVYTNCSQPVCRWFRCSDLGSPCKWKCILGCICKDGYLRDDNGVCIPIKSCPKPPPKCGNNEVYNNCSHPVCRPYNCSNLGFECNFPCIKGCICKTGYLRDDNGDCIPIKCCPSCGGDPNAEYDDGTKCQKTCATYKLKKAPACKPSSRFNSCICKDGYVYDPNVKLCVRPKDCTPTCKDNEVYSTCINCRCPRNCSQLGQPNTCVDPKKCIKGCVCVKGYFRDANGKCVPKHKCPKYPPKCGKNEVYYNCSVPDCGPYLCSQLGYPLKCYKECKPRCICRDGYLRDNNGDCIPIKKCPSCGGDPNAESGCGNNCGQTCATYKLKPPPVCKLACILNGCKCRDGYVYDPNVKACVRPKDCTPTCKVNEEYSPCINGGCGPKSCSQLGQPNICVDPKICIKGCVCIKGYLRDENGKCVPKDKCPPKCPYGEVWDTCPTMPCEGDWCPKTKDSPQTCPTGDKCWKPRCVCGYNRKRDPKTGKCILIKDCPPFKCGHNEEYKACPSNCPGERCSDYINKPKCPIYKIGIIVNCRPACKCIKGTYRNADGKCIPACDCPTHPVQPP